MSVEFEQLKKELIAELSRYEIANPGELGTNWADSFIRKDPQRYAAMSQSNLAAALAFNSKKGSTNYTQVDFESGGIGYNIIIKRYDWSKIKEEDRMEKFAMLVASIKRYLDAIRIFQEQT